MQVHPKSFVINMKETPAFTRVTIGICQFFYFAELYSKNSKKGVKIIKSERNLVARDATPPCKPYSSASHSFIVAVFNCDKESLKNSESFYPRKGSNGIAVDVYSLHFE